jgi:hypothetical protein
MRYEYPQPGDVRALTPGCKTANASAGRDSQTSAPTSGGDVNTRFGSPIPDYYPGETSDAGPWFEPDDNEATRSSALYNAVAPLQSTGAPPWDVTTSVSVLKLAKSCTL